MRPRGYEDVLLVRAGLRMIEATQLDAIVPSRDQALRHREHGDEASAWTEASIHRFMGAIPLIEAPRIREDLAASPRLGTGAFPRRCRGGNAQGAEIAEHHYASLASGERARARMPGSEPEAT